MVSKRNFQPDRNLRLMDLVRQVLRYHRYRYRTEQTYCKWILRYIRHHGGKTHPESMGKSEMGHADIRTTETYLHVMDKSLVDVASPLNQIRRSDG